MSSLFVGDLFDNPSFCSLQHLCSFVIFKTPEMGKSVCKNTQRRLELSLSPPTKTDHAGAAITFDHGGEHKI